MSIINVDTTNPDLTKKRDFNPIAAGIYALEVENDLTLVESKSNSENSVVALELRVVDDGEFKGRKVFDNLVIMGPSAPDKSKAGCEQKIASFAMACGVLTKAQVEAGEGIDLDLFKGCVCQAQVGVKVEQYQGEERKKNVVKNYLFED
jgi:hypothetical protein